MRIRTSLILALALLTPLLSSRSAYAQAADEGEGDEVPVEGASGDSTPPLVPPSERAPAEPQAPAESDSGSGDADVADEDMGEESPARPPPKGKGVVWGVLTDTKLGEPLPEAQVSVVGTKYKTITDLDGRFRLELPPGTYNLRFFYELHEPARLSGVQVVLGEVHKLAIQLKSDEEAVETIEVETEADRAALEGQTLSRQRAAAVGDSVGRAEIARTPDRNAAQAAQRVVGATIVGNRFVYVRGLGERYTNALLNGTPLPSPEPDVNAVPFDLFPALVLDSITIAKTFTPDVPGDFAGGSVRIETREIPGKFLFSPSISFGYNTQSTFRQRLSYRGGGLDWLGFDDGTRKLPSGIPNYKLTQNAPIPGTNRVLTPADLKPYGERINSYMSSQRAFTPPNFGGNMVIGDGFKWGNDQRLGYLVALTYSRSFLKRDEIYREFTPVKKLDYERETGNDAVRWGTFGSVTYQAAKGHRITLTGIRSQLSDNTARIVGGENTTDNAIKRETRLSFISRSLTFGQLRGTHEFKELNGATLDWNVSLARASRDEPDTRDDVWERSPSDELYHYAGGRAQAGRHLFASQSETAYGGGLDWTQPIVQGPLESKIKIGGLVSVRKREFSARTFNFKYPRIPPPAGQPPATCPVAGFSESCADALFRNENIGSVLQLDDATRPEDAYHAKLNVFSGYLMGDFSLARDLRLIGGERIEVTRQTLDPYDQLHTGAKTQNADLNQTDMLPALAVVYSATKQTKVRGSVTRTLARPQLRELAPYRYTAIVGGRDYTGNPDLKLTRITNADLRFEYFPTLREVLAFSFFFKHFSDPIEPIVTTDSITFGNSPGADLLGIELEARKSLEFITPQLKPVSVVSNLTLAHSRIQEDETENISIATHIARPLVNQAPYVFNLALDYANESGTNARLLYNVVGPRVVGVGTGGIDDDYEHPRHLVDVAISQEINKHFGLKLTGENILNSQFLVTQGKTEERVTRRFRDGSIYMITAQYTY